MKVFKSGKYRRCAGMTGFEILNRRGFGIKPTMKGRLFDFDDNHGRRRHGMAIMKLKTKWTAGVRDVWRCCLILIFDFNGCQAGANLNPLAIGPADKRTSGRNRRR